MSEPDRPIGDYGLIGDLRTAALVSSEGAINWWCAPRFDSPSVFARLLDAERGGYCSLGLVDGRPAGRAYEPRTNVLRTAFAASSGRLEVVDAMPLADGGAAGRIWRVATCVEGRVDVELLVAPAFRYATIRPVLAALPGIGGVARGEGEVLVVRGEADLAAEAGRLVARFSLRAGERRRFELAYHAEPDPPVSPLDGADLDAALARLTETWQRWADGCRYQGAYREQVVRSALVLKLLTYDPTGAIVAAPTTSLPEEIGGERNWDYRYSWLRDAAFTVSALYHLGYVDEADAFLDWVCTVSARDAGRLQIVYGVDGERDLPERTLDHLAGHRSSRPVRVGNTAARQFQLDVYGEVLDCVHACRRFGRDRATPLWPHLRDLVDWVCDHWQEPDSGIWEMRGAPRHFVSSKAMAWVALDRGVRMAEELGLPADGERWSRERDAVRAEVLEWGWDEGLGAFAQAYGAPALDAANLLLPLVGFIAADEPRMRATIERTLERLTVNGLVYRYVDDGDGLPGSEGTFAISTFWLIQNLVFLGRTDEAQARFERMLGRANDLGLFSEEIDPTTGELLGNFPQAFTHLGLITAAVHLAQVGEAGRSSGTPDPAEIPSGPL